MPQRQAALSFSARSALACGAGLLYSLGFTFSGSWPATLLGAAGVVALLDDARSAAEAAALAFAAKAVAVVLTLSYLAGLGPIPFAAVTGLYSLAWLPMALAFFGVRRAAGSMAALAALPGLWTVSEWLLASVHFLPSQVPGFATAFAEPALGLAPFVGIQGVTALAVAAATAPWILRLALREARPLAALALPAGTAAALLLPAFLGALRAPSAEGSPALLRVAAFSLEATDALESRLDDEPWSPEQERKIERYIRERLAGFQTAGRPPDLILLPEDAVDLTLPRSRSAAAFARFGIENNGLLIEAYRVAARSAGLGLMTGLTTLREGKRYNSTLLIGKDGTLEGMRDKRRLTPGSEYWPVPSWLPFWVLFSGDRQYIDPAEAYTPGSERLTPFDLGVLKAGASTCVEGHLPSMYLGWRRAGARLLLFLGNAHWFHRDPAPYNDQLLRVVRLSAAAYGLPVVLTGKAGYTGAVDARGAHQVWPWVPDGGREQPHEVAVAPAPEQLTLAARWGEYYLPFSAALGVLAALLGRARTRRSRS